jgi:hypothetical protein
VSIKSGKDQCQSVSIVFDSNPVGDDPFVVLRDFSTREITRPHYGLRVKPFPGLKLSWMEKNTFAHGNGLSNNRHL